jgi:hypothetical protein
MRDALSRIFLGPVRFWLLWVAVLAALYFAGEAQLHVTSFPLFLALLGGLALVSVLYVVITGRGGERITREPIDREG